MSEITVKISIPESEYKQWNDYESGGVEKSTQTLKRELRDIFDKLGIRDFELEVTHNDFKE